MAHFGGVNALAIDKFDGRYLLSGGADSTIAMWDLETPASAPTSATSGPLTYRPLGTVARGADAHKFGITDISWYPFDSLAFLSSSFDATLKLYDALTLVPATSFALDSPVYSHSMSPIAQHILVACGTQHPSVRLVDLRSGVAVQALVGHTGAVLSTAWSPTEEYMLASGSSDGTVRLWDVRRSAAQLGVLDQEDAVGLRGYDGRGSGARPAGRGRAHTGTVNGVVFTEDGRHLVSTGHDERIRVWDMQTGANTLANFGPFVRNDALACLLPCLAPTNMTEYFKDILFFPSEKEILMYEMFEGKLLKRLRGVWGEPDAGSTGKNKGKRQLKDLAWRPFNMELYSAHTDGSIHVWRPWTKEDDEVGLEDEDEERTKKRAALEEIYQDVTKRQRNMFTVQ
ncbi:WD40 repeat-like protein [Microthyrium microscopicum]|uniref:WD40 repeat-like protein n=1 Tax=Microthyrium microscopicum TaxID=703497 RepID=A0A6A6UI42_9PEZI|nr:WD40 repeat-like protein [Microthyrium microscopicum]